MYTAIIRGYREDTQNYKIICLQTSENLRKGPLGPGLGGAQWRGAQKNIEQFFFINKNCTGVIYRQSASRKALLTPVRT
jgi:hypothetical protein